jgi:iron(III) transport system substrate-binding protein
MSKPTVVATHTQRRSARPVLLAILIGAPLVSGCQGDPADVVNVYSHRHYDTDQMLFDRFAEVTGVEVRVVTASADDLITRLQTEAEASPADVLITVDAGRLHRAKELGLLQPVQSAVLEETVPAHLRDPEGRWFGLTQRARVLVYARDRVDPAELSTYEALADSIWSGRIVTRSSENIYNISLLASLIAANGPEAAEAWARGVVANFARPPQGADRDQVMDVAAGVGDVGIVNTYYVGQLLNDPDPAVRERASQVGVFFPNQEGRGAHVNVSGAGVTAHAPNPANAIRLIEFLVSEEAQRSFAETVYEYPVRAGVEWAPTLREWGDFVADDLSLEQLGELSGDAVTTFDRAGWR